VEALRGLVFDHFLAARLALDETAATTTMAPHLRSSSRAPSNNSRPSTPTAILPTADYFYGDSNRPRKQRRTGRNSRVGVEALDDSREATTEPQDVSTNNLPRPLTENGGQPNRQPQVVGADGKISIDQLIADSDWNEPALRDAQPSYKDYTWSTAWFGNNPALSTMKPLGQLPNASDKRKAGIKAPKPAVKEVKETNKKASKKTASQATSTPVNEVVTNTSDPTTLPMFTSSEHDVEKLRSVVQAALRVAEGKGDRAVSQGLREMWDQGAKDPFVLSILDSVMRKNPDAEQKAIFKTFMRAAHKKIQSNLPPTETTEPEPISRSLSTNSITSVSSANLAEATTGKPIMASTTLENGNGTGAVTRGRKRARDSEVLPTPISNVDDVSSQKRSIGEIYDGVEETEDAATVAKRTRRDNFPVVAKPSQMRSSLSRESPLSASAPRTRNRVSKSTNGHHHAADEGPDNNDFCRQCQRSGSLLCCDGCVNSYHFSCLDPPLDPAHPPEGEWFCPSCQMRNSFGSLVKNIRDAEHDFQLPVDIREYYQGVATGKGGVYQQVVANLRPGTHGRGKREGRSEQEYLTRQFDAKGKLIVCIACGLTSNGVRPLVQCDYCPCWWHIDCTDPPLPGPPKQQQSSEKTYHNWMCPNHIDHELYLVHTDNGAYAGTSRIRRPRNPRVIDVDVLPDDSEVEELQETETQGIVYRVSESGLKLNFLERVKRENLEAEIRASAAAQYRDYACQKLDQLVEKATAFYEKAAAPEPTPIAEAQASILTSRSAADREAIANLVAFATENRDAQAIPSERVGYLVDALLASSEDGAPKASSELDSLQALKDLIERRMGALQASQ
jgi:hypothetical protein